MLSIEDILNSIHQNTQSDKQPKQDLRQVDIKKFLHKSGYKVTFKTINGYRFPLAIVKQGRGE